MPDTDEHDCSTGPRDEQRRLDSILDTIDGLRDAASVERAFGDPIERTERTVVPVARVVYGFGGGFGSSVPGTESADAGSAPEEGGGGGGGAVTQPLGVLEITDHETRFVRFTDWKRIGAAVLLGVVFGLLLGRR